MSSIKSAASRYNSFDSRSSTQSHHSDPSSSAVLKPRRNQFYHASGAIVKAKSSDAAPVKVKNEANLSAMVKKLVAGKPKNPENLVIPADFIAEDQKKAGRKESNFAGLHRKLFSKGSAKKEGSEKKALTDVKLNTNTRTLAMVLRSERELLSQNKEQEAEIAELKMMLEEKNREGEKLKDLCLKQREEIKALKSAILFPNVMNSQLQELLENQGSELKQAKQLIPSLQRQVTSLTGQLQCLAEDLAEVKADKYSVRGCFDADINSPKTPAYDREDAANSLEFSFEDHITPGSPDDMFLKDLNPCLTPYYAQTKSKEFEAMRYDPPQDERFSGKNMQFCREVGFDSHIKKLSKSSDCCQCSNSGSSSARAARLSVESKYAYGRQINQKLL
ncbi:Thyroid receptor-interacting protein like [Actinidia chinensis var. chinensis]|uniref:Thyroid receptor-interacting protein like n=1 Tax=Actinidia chinensis var. chinensis TaxID=1590841 RepID=A0A2R6PXC1_ACTCC|nr:Thyroid receptor-interacting protein like [Actinidia chinensis var. chinensis]